jgi:SAM-dependent methyltransferase
MPESLRWPWPSAHFGQRVLIGLDAVGSRLLPFGHAPDISDQTINEERFAGQLRRSEAFGEGFSPPLQVKDKVVLEIGAGLGAMQASFLKRGTARAIALEPDAFFADKIATLVGPEPRLEVVRATIEDCPLPDESVDAVVSDAVFEHIADVPSALREVGRILKPGGLMFAKVGQTWFHFNGPHLITYIHVPWVHLLFSDSTIRAVLERYKKEGRYSAVSVDARIADLDHMNRWSQSRLEAAFHLSDLDVLQCENTSPRAWKSLLGRLPVLKELFAGQLVVVLRKAAVAGA